MQDVRLGCGTLQIDQKIEHQIAVHMVEFHVNALYRLYGQANKSLINLAQETTLLQSFYPIQTILLATGGFA